MSGVTKEQIEAAREIDLLTYLQTNAPSELKRSAPGEYRMASHGSLVISNSRWYWNRGGFGGMSALDYLVKVEGMDFVSAVEAVNGIRAATSFHSLAVANPAPNQDKRLVLPPRARYPTKLLSYLQSRGIPAHYINKCMKAGVLYEGRYNNQAVCVFVGMDQQSTPRFGCMRGISSALKRDCSGSDKRIGFCLVPEDSNCKSLSICEASIDAMSHAVLFPEQNCYRLSLGGTSPVALMHFLENHSIDRLDICLDADDAGLVAAARIQKLLSEDDRYSHIKLSHSPPTQGKDYNQMLQIIRNQEHELSGCQKASGFSI